MVWEAQHELRLCGKMLKSIIDMGDQGPRMGLLRDSIISMCKTDIPFNKSLQVMGIMCFTIDGQEDADIVLKFNNKWRRLNASKDLTGLTTPDPASAHERTAEPGSVVGPGIALGSSGNSVLSQSKAPVQLDTVGYQCIATTVQHGRRKQPVEDNTKSNGCNAELVPQVADTNQLEERTVLTKAAKVPSVSHQRVELSPSTENTKAQFSPSSKRQKTVEAASSERMPGMLATDEKHAARCSAPSDSQSHNVNCTSVLRAAVFRKPTPVDTSAGGEATTGAKSKYTLADISVIRKLRNVCQGVNEFNRHRGKSKSIGVMAMFKDAVSNQFVDQPEVTAVDSVMNDDTVDAREGASGSSQDLSGSASSGDRSAKKPKQILKEKGAFARAMMEPMFKIPRNKILLIKPPRPKAPSQSLADQNNTNFLTCQKFNAADSKSSSKVKPLLAGTTLDESAERGESDIGRTRTESNVGYSLLLGDNDHSVPYTGNLIRISQAQADSLGHPAVPETTEEVCATSSRETDNCSSKQIPSTTTAKTVSCEKERVVGTVTYKDEHCDAAAGEDEHREAEASVDAKPDTEAPRLAGEELSNAGVVKEEPLDVDKAVLLHNKEGLLPAGVMASVLESTDDVKEEFCYDDCPCHVNDPVVTEFKEEQAGLDPEEDAVAAERGCGRHPRQQQESAETTPTQGQSQGQGGATTQSLTSASPMFHAKKEQSFPAVKKLTTPRPNTEVENVGTEHAYAQINGEQSQGAVPGSVIPGRSKQAATKCYPGAVPSTVSGAAGSRDPSTGTSRCTGTEALAATSQSMLHVLADVSMMFHASDDECHLPSKKKNRARQEKKPVLKKRHSSDETPELDDVGHTCSQPSLKKCKTDIAHVLPSRRSARQKGSHLKDKAEQSSVEADPPASSPAPKAVPNSEAAAEEATSTAELQTTALRSQRKAAKCASLAWVSLTPETKPPLHAQGKAQSQSAAGCVRPDTGSRLSGRKVKKHWLDSYKKVYGSPRRPVSPKGLASDGSPQGKLLPVPANASSIE